MILGYIIMVFPAIASVSLFFIFLVFLYDKHKKCKRPTLRYVALFTFIGYCLSLVYLTILWYYPDITFHPKYRFYNIQPFIWVSETYEMGLKKMMQQLVLNIGMYIPYGLLLPVIFKKLRKISIHLTVVFLTTFSIEMVQYIIGRSSDIDDVIMNFLGGILGYILYRMFDHIFQEKNGWKKIINSSI